MLCFAEALEMDDFTLSEELDDVTHVRVIHQPQDVVVGYARLLLCCEGKKHNIYFNPLNDKIKFLTVGASCGIIEESQKARQSRVGEETL